MSETIVVHHLENSRSQRILWLLEELHLEYELKLYKRDAKTGLAPPELLAVHPLGKSPVLSDSRNTVAESGAIIEYLVDQHGAGRLKPEAGSDARLKYTYWLHYAEGSFMPLMLASLLFNRVETAPMPFFVKPVARGIAGKVKSAFLNPNIERHLGFINDTLSESAWFTGDTFTAADVQMSFAVEAAAARANRIASYSAIGAFLERIHQRPAYQAALQRGGPYSLMS